MKYRRSLNYASYTLRTLGLLWMMVDATFQLWRTTNRSVFYPWTRYMRNIRTGHLFPRARGRLRKYVHCILFCNQRRKVTRKSPHQSNSGRVVVWVQSTVVLAVGANRRLGDCVNIVLGRWRISPCISSSGKCTLRNSGNYYVLIAYPTALN